MVKIIDTKYLNTIQKIFITVQLKKIIKLYIKYGPN